MLTWICFDETVIPNTTKWLQRELCSGYSLTQRATYHITLENKTGQSVTRVTPVYTTYRLDGRKMEECAGELANMSHCK